MQWNEEHLQRKSADSNSYAFRKKIDFILKDSNDNELNTGEFKRKNVSKKVKITQQVKNIRDNKAILIESKKLIKNDIAVNGIDYIDDIGYLYEIVHFQDVIAVLPVPKLNTLHNLVTLNHFGDTLNSLYYLKCKLVKLSDEVKIGKSKESFKYDLIDIFNMADDDKDNYVENEETNIFYATRSKS
ncbi:MAG: hypothetical protein EXX96DRAFT_570340 [Benjaminiella poitrasii]|nr:MAG: hypothetical protein EXX96DRAFT_570340 [Benjaminiella poitrasii]